MIQLIELWETFLMQLDADDDDEPFYKPPLSNPAPIPTNPPQKPRDQETATEGGTAQEAATAATIEQEE